MSQLPAPQRLADHIAVSTPRGHCVGTPDTYVTPMGDDMWLTRIRYDGIAVTDNRRFPGIALRILVAVPDNDRWILRRGRDLAQANPCVLAVADPSEPLDFRAFVPGNAVVLDFPMSWLTLPVDTVRRGIDGLNDANPLSAFVGEHLTHLGGVGATCPMMLPDLAPPTIQLIRSLLLMSVRTGEPSPSTELIVRVKLYIDEHLTDADLCAGLIASQHSISTRKLYAEWPNDGPALGDYIIRRRLERARDALITRRHLTIPAVARSHGFVDPTHFAKRFRMAFGVSPSQWRRDNAG
ncbi:MULTISPECIES: AraC family transcriptional regulator [Gordonia]|uniref:AraC family transcriptional regulator n=1 Tax=Gordonia tangerina TaxID=2911060 RepID=A0ABS9DJD7_9ACTN|nr:MULTISPECIES: AraC family transcriptional regulator [Gordonia]MCF3939178.1 AraC family transcriptional regulator [Gordonia tangerina]